LALKRLETVKASAVKYPDAYPPLYVLGAFMSGAFKRNILPERKKK